MYARPHIRPLRVLIFLFSLGIIAGPALSEDAIPLPARVIAKADQTLIDAPYLLNILPQSTLAYVRIPNVWGLLAAPKGNLFDSVVRSAAYAQVVQTVRDGVLANILPELPQEWRPLADLLLAQARSPLELAIFTSSQDQMGPPLPEALLTVRLEQGERAAVNALLQRLAAQIPGMMLADPVQADGSGTLSVFGLPIDLWFDAPQHRLFLRFANPMNHPSRLAQRIAALSPTPLDHPVRKANQALDASNQGLLLWLDPTPLLQTAELFGRVEEVAMLRAVGLSEAHSVAIGVGVSEGKGRIKLAIDMPQVGFRSFMPAINTDLPFKAAGTPETLFMVGLPGAADLARLEGSLRSLISADNYQIYQAVKEQIPAIFGLTIEQILGSFGNELLVIHDQAGYYAALRLRDPTAYKTLLQKLVKQFALKYETRDLLGTTFHHLTFASSETAPANEPTFEQRLVDRLSHLYWIEEQGYLVFADVPQVLMDRLYTKTKVAVRPWLRQEQGVDASGALLLATTRTPGVPRLMYELNLWLLTYLGDLTGHPVDLFLLPSAHELHLPNSGAYSLQFTSSPQQLGVELVYESNPIEGVLALGGLQTLITTGLVAAIAIPAYVNFDHAHQPLAISIAPLHALQVRLNAFYQRKGRFPSEIEAAPFMADFTNINALEIQLTPDSGKVTAHFHHKALEKHNELILLPIVKSGDIHWQCAGNLEVQYMPHELCPE